ncbi:MAG: enoyl-CoA hydratase-related protein [Hyphomicrobiales bacterium]
MEQSGLKISVDGAVATLTLNRPDELNSFTRELWTEFKQAVEELDASGKIRALVIASTGKHFTAGMDLSVFQTMPDMSGAEAGRHRAEVMRTVRRYQEVFSSLERARFPVIAAVQGGCIGAGVDMVAACDLRYCAEDAFFCIQEINVGMAADVGTFPRLQRVMSESVVREMAYTGCRLDAQRAMAAGLVNGVCGDAEKTLEAALETARVIAGKSPLAVWGSKEIMNYGLDHSTEDTLKHIATWQSGMFQEADILESIKARQEKRDAIYDDLLPDEDVI